MTDRRLQIWDVLRVSSPLVRDLLEGISKAVADRGAKLVPSPPTGRPDLHSVPADWPPRAAPYSDHGEPQNASAALIKLGLALTYPEVAAFLVGLTAGAAIPRPWQVEQIECAARALTAVLMEGRREPAAYRAAWRSLFELAFAPVKGGSTLDLVPLVLPVEIGPAVGTHRVSAECLLESGFLSGSLQLAGTFARGSNGLRLLRSDQILAQLDKDFVGVRASFQMDQDSAVLVCRGLTGRRIDWSAHLSRKSSIARHDERT